MGVDEKTVDAVRGKLESTAEIPQLGTTLGADGKERRIGELMAAQRDSVGMAKPPGADQYLDRVERVLDASIKQSKAGIDKHLGSEVYGKSKISEELFAIVRHCPSKAPFHNNTNCKTLYSNWF